MKPFSSHNGLVAPMDRANIDTDAILPVQFMKSVERTGFGQFLFDGLRYLDAGEPGLDCSTRQLDPTFVLNQTRYLGASILLARANFGCGSSREHAPWALEQFGFRVLIASSFADIFYENSFKSGLLPIALDEAVIDGLFDAVEATPGYGLQVDLATQTIVDPNARSIRFAIDPAHKAQLAAGLDPVSATLAKASQIRAFESRHRLARPWLVETISTGDRQ